MFFLDLEMNFSEILWIFILIMIFETVSLSSSLTGDHVCSRVEKLVSHKIRQLNISVILIFVNIIDSILYITYFQRETFT